MFDGNACALRSRLEKYESRGFHVLVSVLGQMVRLDYRILHFGNFTNQPSGLESIRMYVYYMN
jgi:hypothetical protein